MRNKIRGQSKGWLKTILYIVIYCGWYGEKLSGRGIGNRLSGIVEQEYTRFYWKTEGI